MDKASIWISLVQVCAPILIALIGIIPTVITNRKKTQESLTAMMTEIKADNEETNRKVDAVSNQLSDHIKEDEADKARQARTRILRFYDEVCEGKLHSESHFEDILDDIDFYESYCEEHRDFKNNRGKAAMEHIREVYTHEKQTGGFLVHKQN